MKRMSLAVTMMGIVLGTACQSTPEELTAGPARPAAHTDSANTHADNPTSAVRLSFAPGDLTSATFSTPITLFVDAGGGSVDETLLQRIASQIELRTYPELSPVDADIEVVPSAPPGRPVRSGDRKDSDGVEPLRSHPGRASIVVRPLAPLASRWHVVSLAALPAGTLPVAWTGVEDPALGAFAARFHPASAPVLREVRLCEKQHGRATRLLATFSEGLRIDAARAAKLVRAADARSGESCTLVPPAAPDIPQTTLEIDCPGSLVQSPVVDLDLSAGLESMSGTRLSSIEARGRAVEIRDAIDFAEADAVAGCRTVKMQ